MRSSLLHPNQFALHARCSSWEHSQSKARNIYMAHCDNEHNRLFCLIKQRRRRRRRQQRWHSRTCGLCIRSVLKLLNPSPEAASEVSIFVLISNPVRADSVIMILGTSQNEMLELFPDARASSPVEKGINGLSRITIHALADRHSSIFLFKRGDAGRKNPLGRRRQ